MLRTNINSIDSDKEDLQSLDPLKRDDLYGKHVNSTPLIVAERLYKFPLGKCKIDSIQVMSPTNPYGIY